MILIKKLKGCHRMLLIKLVNSIKWKKWKICSLLLASLKMMNLENINIPYFYYRRNVGINIELNFSLFLVARE